MTGAGKAILVRMLTGGRVRECRDLSRLIRHGYVAVTTHPIRSAFATHLRRTRYHLTDRGTAKAVEIVRTLPAVRPRTSHHSPSRLLMIEDRYGQEALAS